MQEYMTGEELFDKWRCGSAAIVLWEKTAWQPQWNNLAAELRIPRPPKPKTPGQVLCEYQRDGQWEMYTKRSQQGWEEEAAELRDALNAAQAAIDMEDSK